jgi:hypothetical protein
MRVVVVVFALLASSASSAQGRAAVGCPATAPAASTVAVSGVLVPKGATTVLLCRYRGLNPAATARRLARSRLLSSGLAQLIAEFDALPKASGVVHCPMDDGSEITATFRYPAAAIRVDIALTGCRTVSRGRLVRSASGPAGTRLIDRLTSLLRS